MPLARPKAGEERERCMLVWVRALYLKWYTFEVESPAFLCRLYVVRWSIVGSEIGRPLHRRPRIGQHGRLCYVSDACTVVLPFDFLEPHVEFYTEFSMVKLMERSAQHCNVEGERVLFDHMPFS